MPGVTRPGLLQEVLPEVFQLLNDTEELWEISVPVLRSPVPRDDSEPVSVGPGPRSVAEKKGACIRDFRADKLSSFRALAELCITRQIITAIKTATRQKHIPLNSYISLNKPIYDEDSDRTMLDILSGTKVTDPEEVFISHELSGDLRDKIQQNLSELESQVLMSYLEGKSYQEMAKELNRHVKSIDNALQRVKRKIEKTLGDKDR